MLGESSCCMKLPLSSSDIHTGIAVGFCSILFFHFWMLFNFCGSGIVRLYSWEGLNTD